MSEIDSKLTDCIRTIFDEYKGPVGPELTAKHVPQWDSLANVQLMVIIEQAFGIRFTTDEITSLRNLGELNELIGVKKG